MDWVVHVRRVRASAERVWSALTEPDELAVWVGTWRWSPQQGSSVVDFSFVPSTPGMPPLPVEVSRMDPGHGFTVLMREPGRPDPWRIDIELVPQGGRTVIRLAEVIVNHALAPSVASGTEYYLDRLVAVLEGRDPDLLDVDDYFLKQSEHYRTLFPVQRRPQ